MFNCSTKQLDRRLRKAVSSESRLVFEPVDAQREFGITSVTHEGPAVPVE